MRVLHVISGLDAKLGGPTVAVAGLAIAQREAGAEVSLVSTWRPGEDNRAAETLRQRGVEVDLVGPTTIRLRRHPDLHGVLARGIAQADVVHIHALWEEPQHLTATLARYLCRPYLISPHGMLDPWSLAQRRWKKRLYMLWRLRRNLESASALHFTTERERELTARLHLRARPIIEPIGLDISEFNSPPTGAFRSRLPQTQGRPVVLFMSRLHYKKGLDLLVPAFAKLADRNAMLVIAGPDTDDYQAQIQQQVDHLGISDRVIFTGMLRGVERIAALADADLFVLPSYQENFGIVVIESLAAGTPVIISDQVNLESEIRGAGVGAVVPLDVDRLSREMDRWLADPGLRRSASAKAQVLARERYDWRQIARRFLDHYASLSPVREPVTAG